MSSPQLSPIENSANNRFYYDNFASLKRMLEDETVSLSRTASILTSTVNTAPDGDKLFGRLSQLWAAVIDIILQTPYDHHWQNRMISFLQATTRVPRPTDRPDLHTVENYNVDMGRFWDQLPAFKYAVFGEWSPCAPWDYPVIDLEECNGKDHGKPYGTWTAGQFLNLNAFMAKCTHKRLPEGQFPRHALQVLCHALEQERTVEGLDTHVPPAAMWILYAGQWIYENEDTSESVQSVAFVGTRLYNWPEGYNRERWNWWKRRFEEIMNNGEVKERTRLIAKRACDKMIYTENPGQGSSSKQ